MRVYEISYKRWASDTDTTIVRIAAQTVEKALEGFSSILRKRHYITSLDVARFTIIEGDQLHRVVR